MIFLPFKRKKTTPEKIFGVLDIGSESVKFLVARKNLDDEKITLLGKGIRDYEIFDVFDSREFELDIMKKAILEAKKEAEKEAGIEIKNLIVGLPAHVFKAQISYPKYSRAFFTRPITAPEKERILESVFQKARKEVAKKFVKKSGILPREIQFLSNKILEAKIHGYRVTEILGVGGYRLDFRILVTFLPKYYLKRVEGLIKDLNFEILEIVHETEGLVKILTKAQDALFLDIGADFTQTFLVKNGNLEKIFDFELGGKSFLFSLCKNFGVLYKEAKGVSERYQRGFLGEEMRARLKEIFKREAQNWFSNLKEKLKNQVFFENIFLFGGGAFFPEIREVLEKNLEVSVKNLELKDIPGIEDRTKRKDNLQFIPAIFLSYAS